jgi:hypothetical protein
MCVPIPPPGMPGTPPPPPPTTLPCHSLPLGSAVGLPYRPKLNRLAVSPSLVHTLRSGNTSMYLDSWKRRSPVLGSKYSRQITTCVYWEKDSVHIGNWYNASHYWIFYQNKKQMCRMLRILNTFQKNNFRRSWKISHGTWWVTFGFPRLF